MYEWQILAYSPDSGKLGPRWSDSPGAKKKSANGAESRSAVLVNLMLLDLRLPNYFTRKQAFRIDASTPLPLEEEE